MAGEAFEGRARNGDVSLWWDRRGDRVDRAVLLHPGGGDTADVFPSAFVDPLVESGWTVVRFDPRDAGRSTRTPDEALYSLPDLADDLWAVADAAGASRLALVGYSLGSAVVQTAAARAPERVDALVLIAAPARPPDMLIDDRAMAQVLTAGGGTPDEPIRLAPDGPFFAGTTDKANVAAFRRRVADGRAPTARSAGRQAMALLGGPIPSDDELHAVTAPVLVIHSVDDAVLPHRQAESTARPYPNCDIRRVAGVAHVSSDAQWAYLGTTVSQALSTA